MKLKYSTKLFLLAIILIAGTFRFFNIDWDQGNHLHPDERAIIMTTEKLSLPQNISQFLSPDSPWNTNFFAYGSLPFYLLYFSGQALSPINPEFSSYSLLNIVGRFISAFSDLATVIILFFLGRKLFNEKVGLISASLYSISVLPIQLSHFYAVDTPLTLFITTTLYFLVLFYQKPSIKKALLVGLCFGLALATKISAIILILSIGTALLLPRKTHRHSKKIAAFIMHILKYSLLIALATIATFILIEPYAVIDFKNFLIQTLQQSAMTKNAFTFPYTLQYAGKIPYLYELKNIFLFGLGPVIALTAFIGISYFIYLSTKRDQVNKRTEKIIPLIFFVAYFFTVGNFAIGFMRYMLPIYPLLCLFGAIIILTAITFINKKIQNSLIKKTIYIVFTIILLIWPVSFLHIYTQNNTRVDATNWITSTIPAGKTLAVEHWDDQLPLIYAGLYESKTLALYEPDTDKKWQTINSDLKETDYIIIASNRLYTPLQKLTDCDKLPTERCYKRTAHYYNQLFSEKLGFVKVAEFTNYPTIPFINITINDQSADESFTVYDHPKIMIFKNVNR